MSVRVVARVRPLLKTERDCDVVVRSGTSGLNSTSKNDGAARVGEKPVPVGAKKQKEEKDKVSTVGNTIWIPNPKNAGEEYSFKFNSVYDEDASQQELFDTEVAPTVKHLFSGFDITLFAYGVTGTGKTHTMRGGKSLKDRGVIPRLLSGIYRRCRKIERDSEGQTKVVLAMSYYEIYNDKVFDLFEPVDKRTPSGLPLRDNGGKTVVVGLSERPCGSLKEFEVMYDQANMNRSTSATKLNAHSSRSHAVLSVKLTITTGERTRVSTASCIDLAGSEDNRRTENGKERMVESASINKSLFVLAQCVEAISKKHSRIPYRESKMTRILGLGQNNGLTIMILNLAPVRSYHLDTLSSLNFANRTKRIEVREIENEPMFKGPPRCAGGLPSAIGPSMHRQPLRPLAASINANIGVPAASEQKPSDGKPVKAFSVYMDKAPTKQSAQGKGSDTLKRKSPLKRGSGNFLAPASRPSKVARVDDRTSSKKMNEFSAEKFEEMVEKKVNEVLAAKKLGEPGNQKKDQQEDLLAQSRELNEQVQRRLELLEQRIEGKDDARAEGLSYLLMAKQHQARGEEASALRMYQLAQPFFPSNEKLASKIEALKDKTSKRLPLAPSDTVEINPRRFGQPKSTSKRNAGEDDYDNEYQESDDQFNDEDHDLKRGSRKVLQVKRTTARKPAFTCTANGMNENDENGGGSPRTSHILSIINTRDIDQIKLLRGMGTRKAESIVDRLREMDNDGQREVLGNKPSQVKINTLAQLEKMKGVGSRTVENMRNGIGVL